MLSSPNSKANCVGPSDPKTDSYNYDDSKVCFTSPLTRRNMSSCCPREIENKMSQSSMDLIARGGQDGGKTISYSQREMVDIAVNLNARHRHGCGQGETTTLCTPRAMETRMVVSSEDLTVGKTSLSTPRVIDTKNVESSGGLIAGKTTSCATTRAMETEFVDADGDSIAEQEQDDGQGNETKFSTSGARETETVVCTVDLMSRRKQISGKGGNRTSGTPKEMKNKMEETSEESISGCRRVCGRDVIETGPSSPEGKATDKKRDLCFPERVRSFKQGARRGMQDTWNQPTQKRARIGEPNKEICKPGPSSIMEEDPSPPKRLAANKKRGLPLLERVRSCKRGTKRGMQGTSSQPTQKRVRRGEQNKEISNPGPSSIMENGPSPERQAANKERGSSSSERVRSCKTVESETVVCTVDLMSRRKQISGKGGNRTSGTPKEMKNKMEETSEESISGCRRICGRDVIETGPSSPEGKATDKKRDLCFPERVRSFKQGARRGMQDTWNQPTQKRARIGEPNKEICKPGPSSIMEEDPSPPKRLAANKKRGLPLLERVRSCKRGTKRGMQGTSSQPTQKRVRRGEQNKEISNPGPSSIMENGPSPERQAANKERGSSSSERVRSCKKTTFSWLIDSKIIKEYEHVTYKSATMKKTISGRITRGGILCSCCQEEISMWTFEKHAGSDLRQPYKYIYLRRKHKSLQKCLIEVWLDAREQKHRQMFSYVPKETDADQSDDLCLVCGDGGDLICCDKCPSTYHLSCMNMERVPQNDWFCPYCVCKHCGLVVDLVVEKKKYYEKKEGFKCSQCDKKCHWECFKKFEKEFSKQTLDLNPSTSYCGPGCQEIYEKMGVSLGIRKDYSAKYSWRVIRLMETSKKDPAVMSLYLENNSKVAVTWMLMNEAFETITDRKTGINVVRSIVYSCKSNLTRIDFSRFYMFVLEEDDEIIAAASIRFHGTRIAEMPFIATEMAYRGQGVCQELMRIIESFLCNLKVENLIIPSAVETSDMWKRKYNFTELSKELKKEISSYKILMFPSALRLYKDLSASVADIKNDQELQAEHAEVTEHGP